MAGKQAPIRIGIVGAGANTRSRHIPGLLAHDGVQLIAVANRRRASSERVARDYGIARVHDHWRQVVAADDLDAIVIGTWPYLHCPVTLAALATGKHVLTEARMAMNLAEAEMMLAASRRAPHLVTQIVPGGGSLHADATIRRLIADGYLGDIVAVEVKQSNGFIDREAPFHWRHNTEYSGLNIMRMGILYEDVLFWLGPAVRLSALGRTFVKMRTDEDGVPRAISIPDHLDIIGEMACGAQLHMQLSAVTGHGTSEITIHGTEATLRVEGGRLLGGTRDDQELRPIALPPAKPRPAASHPPGWHVEAEFIKAIRGEGSITRTRFEDGAQYMAFTEAVHCSMREGRTVAV